MPVFEIEHGGKVFEVESPNADAAMRDFNAAIGGGGKPSVAEDLAKTAPAALVRGTAAAATPITGMLDAVDQGWQWLVSKGLEKAGALTPEQAEGIRKPLPGLEDGHFRAGMPRAKVFTEATEKAIGAPLYRPQTIEGEFLNTALEFAPGAVFGSGSAAQRLMQVAAPAVTSETAGQIARQVAPEYETAARLAGGGAATIGTAVAQTPRGARAVASEALQGFTRQEIDAAQQLMHDAARLPGGGVALTFDEALNQVTGGRASRLSQLNRVVTNSGGEGGETMSQLYAQRPDQVARTGERAVNSIAPTPYPAEMAAQRGQEAAEAALGELRTGRTEAVRPWYGMAHLDELTPDQVRRIEEQINRIVAENPNPEVTVGARDLLGRLEAQPAQPGTAATRTPVTDPRTSKIIRYDATPATPGTPAVPRTNVGELDQAYQAVRDTHAGELSPLATSTERAAQRSTTRALGVLNDELTATSYPLAQGRQIYSTITDQIITPAENGPLGKIARTDPGGQGATQSMGRALAGVGEGDRYAGVVQQSVRRMVRQDPRAAETLARDYIGDVFNRAVGDLKSGPDQYGGAGFRAALVGDPASMRNVEALVTSLPQGQQRWTGFQRFLDVMEATGFKPVKGSDTAFNQAIQTELKSARGPISAAIEEASKGGLGLKQAISDRWARYRMGQNTSELAWMLTDRQAAPLLRQLASAPVGSNRAAGIALRLTYLGERAANSGSQPTQPVAEGRQ
jgi:hypothetical protein